MMQKYANRDAGRRANVSEIKSTEGIDICWVEEAEKTSEESWKVLIPTVRKKGSEFWVTFNADQETDPTYKRFVLRTPPNAWVRKVSWRDNPWFPEELEEERQYLKKVDPDAYLHVWEGECRKSSAAQVLNGKCVVHSFEPTSDWDGPYQGIDWGFAVDPTTLVRCWIYEGKLFIEHEAYGVSVDIDKTAALFDRVPRAREYVSRADNARPETISYMQRAGYPNVVPVDKWSGSVEDGVAFLRQFEQIVIHPRCVHTAEESRLWSYKVDRITEDILPDLVDKHNHCWDAVRYALEPMIQQAGMGMLHFMREAAEAARSKREQDKRN